MYTYKEAMGKPVAVDLFGGAGGISEGLKLAGFLVPVASDADGAAEATHRMNHPGTRFIPKRVEELTGKAVWEEVEASGLAEARCIDLLAGGPPCQGFSVIGPRTPQDYRNRLVLHFLRLVREIRPKAFAMENVFGMVSYREGRALRELVYGFRELGYLVTAPAVLNAASYGVPQVRKRLFLLGVSREEADRPLTYPPASHGPLPRCRGKYSAKRPLAGTGLVPCLTVRDAISDLPTVPSEGDTAVPYPLHGQEKLTPFQRWARDRSPEALCNHHTKGYEAVRAARIRALKQGENASALPAHLRAGGFNNKYRRLEWDRPAPTVTAHIAKDLSDFIHPSEDRWITVREAARLQSFRDSYIFLGSQFQQLKHVGNAVPPLLAAAVFYHIGKELGLDVSWEDASRPDSA